MTKTTKSVQYPSAQAADPKERDQAAWVAEQRKAYREGKLTVAQKKRLEALPGWSWDDDQDDPQVDCPCCEGSGKVNQSLANRLTMWCDCPNCGGPGEDGLVADPHCGVCEGKGLISREEFERIT